MTSDYNYCLIFLLIIIVFTGCADSTDLEWKQEQGYQWAALSTDYFGSTGFEALSSDETGIRFKNYISKEKIKANRNFLNGSGLTTADVDGDGLVDIYFARLEGTNILYKNMGSFEFKDITRKAGLAHKGYHSTGVTFADVNGDRHPDLLITSLKKENELYINDGDGHFSLQENSGLGSSKGSNTMALADIDGDGDLDLYIVNYKIKTVRDLYSARELSVKNTVARRGDSLVVLPPFDQYYGIIQTDGRSYRNEYGTRDALYLNEGEGTFRKVNDKAWFFNEDGSARGLSRDWGLTAQFQDINADGHPDLYVANDFWTPDRLWINRGDGTFKSIEKNAIRSMSFSAMGVDFSDINRDGAVDIFVTEMLSAKHQRRLRQFSEHLDPINGRPQYNQNSLYLNRGDNTFAQISRLSNTAATEWSWATNFLDVDLDGYEDLIIATGYAYDYQDIDTQIKLNNQSSAGMDPTGDIVNYPSLKLPNKMLRNEGNLTFTDKSAAWGFTESDISHGVALADLDNDGDADFVTNRFNKHAAVFKNKTNAPRIMVQLRGNPPNTYGIGAKITLKGASVVQQKEIHAGGTYVSGSQPAAFFAADEQNDNHILIVRWPDGTTTRIDSIKANRAYRISQTSAGSDSKGVPKADSSLFKDISNRIGYTHHEDPYTDTNVQPLLPVYLSRKGPGISWIDYDRDGDDDLFIASGKGGRTGIFENTSKKSFKAVKAQNPLQAVAPGDQTTILGWTSQGRTNIVVGSANFEQGNPQAPSATVYASDANEIREIQKIPGILSTTGPLAAADYDGDGDVDLFVGGSFKPAQYPRNAASRLFVNEDGRFVPDRPNSAKFAAVGLINGAVFTDFDLDGDPDLLISRSWDSIMLFKNTKGNFVNISSDMGLDKFKGWWKGVATGDFSSDGRPDIVATNIGGNSVYQPMEGHPLKLFYSDFDMNGTLDIIDSYYNKKQQAYMPRRSLYQFDSMPSVAGAVKTHKAYARSSVEEIFGQDSGTIPSKEINTVQHMVFMNNGSTFTAQPLPKFAQFTAAYAAAVADFNSDGSEDLFLSQNSFSFPDDIPRMDAGRGLLLFGNGDGTFRTVKGQKSGIKIYGEQRGAAVSDFNQDGRTDLAVTQNREPLKLYLNQTDKQGIRIHLRGPDKNKDAIGSAIRLLYTDGRSGPRREIQAGSGYWSQHSTTEVLGTSGKVQAVEVRWYTGKTDTFALDKTKKEYLFKY